MSHANIAFFIPHLGCPHQCSFCDQKSISGAQNAITPSEIVSTCKESLERLSKEKRKNTQIAFFGGSFTAIDRKKMEQYLDCVQPFIGQDGFSGIRISTRPDAIDRQMVSYLKSMNVKAIELGAQSMDDHVLKINRRGHTQQQTKNASMLIKEQSLEFGLQMMTGLLGDSKESAMQNAEKISKLSPDTVRIYPTVVLKNTYLGELYLKGEYEPFDTETSVEICAKLLRFFEEKKIKVIRVGLHAQKGIEKDFLAGCYHPAFRELCESKIFFDKIYEVLRNKSKGKYTFEINPKDCSKAIGQSRKNIISFKKMGYDICFKQNKDLKINEFKFYD